MSKTGLLLDKTVVGCPLFVPKVCFWWCSFVVKTVCLQAHPPLNQRLTISNRPVVGCP